MSKYYESRLIQPRGLKFPILITSIKPDTSRLIQPRGLKFTTTDVKVEAIGRGLYSLVD